MPAVRAPLAARALGVHVGTMRLPMKKLIASRAGRTERRRRGTKYFAGGGGGAGPAKPKVARRGKKKAGKRGTKEAKASGPKALVVEVAAAA